MAKLALLRKIKKYVLDKWIGPINYSSIKKWYNASDNPKKLKALKGIHQGKRCFLVGNGPSLRGEDLDKIKNEISFASNLIYKIYDKTEWRPYYYIIGDLKYSCQIDAEAVEAKKRFVGLEILKKPIKKYKSSELVTLYLKNTKLKNGLIPDVHTEIDEYVGSGHTVLFEAFEFAVYMGCTEFYLLGVDCDYSSRGAAFYDSKELETISVYDPAEKMVAAWLAVKEYADRNNIKVYNASRGGKLDIFPRVSFDEVYV